MSEQANPEQKAGAQGSNDDYVAEHVQIGGGFGGMKPLARTAPSRSPTAS